MTTETKFKYSSVSAQQLVSWLHRYRRNQEAPKCELGHDRCGCTDRQDFYSTFAVWPCAELTIAELRRRQRSEGDEETRG